MNSFKSRVKKPAAYKPKQLAASSAHPGVISQVTNPAVKQIPSLGSMVANRDWTGVITLCEFELANGDLSTNPSDKDKPDQPTNIHRPEILKAWIAFACFHSGDYSKALDLYQQLADAAGKPIQSAKQSTDDDDSDDDDSEQKKQPAINPPANSNNSSDYVRPSAEHWTLYAACCQFYSGNYTEAQTIGLEIVNEANKQTVTPAMKSLATRLLFHCSHKLGDEASLMKYHGKMTESKIDQLSLASIHYLRNHFQEATDIYKKLLLVDRDLTAIQVYVAMCYYKLDYYDVSLEILAPYCAQNPDSATAINLKACNHFKLYEGKAAEQECKGLIETLQSLSSTNSVENDLIRHNLVVFRQGQNALSVLPPLINIIPEARLNLCIYHLRNHEIDAAEALMKDLEPTTPQEYILKGVVASAVGQLTDSKSHLKAAQEYFQLVGASASECDTIPGRQCMASCFFLLKQFDDVLIYLNSIKAYSAADSTFYFNHGIALSATEQFAEAIEAFEAVTDPATKASYTYLSWLARCYCMTGQPRQAWELYLKMESNADSYSLLVLLANDCYKIGEFFYAMKAYDVLERLDPSTEHWEGKRGAAIGVLQAVIAKKERRELLKDVINMLKSNQSNAQAEQIARIIRKYCVEVGIAV